VTTSSHYSLANTRKAICHFVLGRGASALAGVAGVVLLARHMHRVDYAGYIAVTSLLMLMAMVSSLGLERATARFVPEGLEHRHAKELFSFVGKLACLRFAIALLAVCILVLAWPLIISLFSEHTTLPAMPWSVPVFLVATTVFAFFSGILQSLLEQKLLTRFILTQSGGRLLIIVGLLSNDAFITLDQSLWVMAVPELVVAVAIAVVTLSILRKRSTPAMHLHGQWPDWREVWHISIHTYSFNMLAMLPQGYFMRLLVAAILPAYVTAAYGFFSTLVDRIRIYLPIQFMYSLIEPVLIANYLHNKDTRALTLKLHAIYKANVIVLLPAIIVIAIMGEPIISFLMKSRYGEYSWMLVLLLVQVTIAGHVLALQLFFNTLKATHLLNIAGFGALAIMAVGLGLTYLDPTHYWLLICPILYEVAMNAIALYLARKKGIAYAFPTGNYLRLGLFCLIPLLAAKLLLFQFGAGLQSQMLASVAMVGLFFALSFKLGAITQNEIAMVKRLATKK
jgi:O-antigen/teichoic acid export membrane protein